jgi:hypothetical protein
MYDYQVKAATGKVYPVTAKTPEDACRRMADLHRVTIVAWRYSHAPMVKVVHPSQIIG